MTGLNRPADIDESHTGQVGKVGRGRVCIEEKLRPRPARQPGLGRHADEIEEKHRPPVRKAGHDDIEED
jgi:hypothetical protein